MEFSESCQVGLVTNSFILQVGFSGPLYNVNLTLGIYLKWLRVIPNPPPPPGPHSCILSFLGPCHFVFGVHIYLDLAFEHK